MAGSRKYFVYTDDRGNDWGINRDESNTEAVNAGTQDFPNTGAPTTDMIPRNLKPRFARYRSTDGSITRVVICLTLTIFNGIDANLPSFVDAVSGITVFLVAKIGEQRVLPFGQDTGLNDGDAT